MTKKIVVDLVEAAQMFGVSDRHLRRLWKKGQFPEPVRLGGSVRWIVADLEQWLTNGCKNSKDASRRA